MDYIPSVMNSAEFTPEQLLEITKGVQTDFLSIETEKPLDMNGEVVKMMIMLIALMIFMMMCILYGYSITGLLVADKSNKLIENLMISMTPVSNIIGKVSAVCAMALVQFASWVISIIAGMKVADRVVSQRPSAVTYETLLKDHGFSTDVITTEGVIFALSFLVLGLILYIVISAFISSFSDKLEEATITFNIYAYIIMIVFMVCFYAVMNSDTALLGILKLIPFTAPFVLPADLISDSFNLGTSIISAVLMIVTIAVMGYLAAYVYKSKIFNKNSKLFGKKAIESK
jgi:ABC-type Na+ efflux pump permease subunit